MNYKLKSYFVPRLVNYPKLHFLGSKLFDAYSKLTSFNHILPNFYIIGGQKCGTTSMFDYLSRHPSVFPATVKDIRFYDKYFHKGQDWYKTYFPSKTEETFNQLFHNVVLGQDPSFQNIDRLLKVSMEINNLYY